jgi:glycine cleavage system H lipoate-binding protein
MARGGLKDTAGKPAYGWADPHRYARTAHEEHKCRHMLSGRVPLNYCTNNYDCGRCAFDQMLDDVDLLQDAPAPPCEWVAGFSLAKNYYFHKGHMWARVEYGGRIRVGLDDFALRLFGAPDNFDLPDLGEAVGQGEAGVRFVRDKRWAQALSPVKGVVVALNPRVKQKAAEANASPYGSGWLMVVAPNKLTSNLRNLYFGQESEKWMENEAGRLTALVAEETHYRLAATGGRVMEDVFGNLPDLKWERLVHEFLLT